MSSWSCFRTTPLLQFPASFLRAAMAIASPSTHRPMLAAEVAPPGAISGVEAFRVPANPPSQTKSKAAAITNHRKLEKPACDSTVRFTDLALITQYRTKLAQHARTIHGPIAIMPGYRY